MRINFAATLRSTLRARVPNFFQEFSPTIDYSIIQDSQQSGYYRDSSYYEN